MFMARNSVKAIGFSSLSVECGESFHGRLSLQIAKLSAPEDVTQARYGSSIGPARRRTLPKDRQNGALKKSG
jgi:hypothetical protein